MDLCITTTTDKQRSQTVWPLHIAPGQAQYVGPLVIEPLPGEVLLKVEVGIFVPKPLDVPTPLPPAGRLGVLPSEN